MIRKYHENFWRMPLYNVIKNHFWQGNVNRSSEIIKVNQCILAIETHNLSWETCMQKQGLTPTCMSWMLQRASVSCARCPSLTTFSSSDAARTRLQFWQWSGHLRLFPSVITLSRPMEMRCSAFPGPVWLHLIASLWKVPSAQCVGKCDSIFTSSQGLICLLPQIKIISSNKKLEHNA